MRRLRAFSLIELLVVVAILAILAAIIQPVIVAQRAQAAKTVCLSQLRQMGVAIFHYVSDADERLPDRRDIKTQLGYRPWTQWPPSDPRAGWIMGILAPYKVPTKFECPATKGLFPNVPMVVQEQTNYWMWRFDQVTDPVPLDNFWGKSADQAWIDLVAANNPVAGKPEGISEVELIVDPYFPKTIPSVSSELKGLTGHRNGRNRLMLDGSCKFFIDARTTK